MSRAKQIWEDYGENDAYYAVATVEKYFDLRAWLLPFSHFSVSHEFLARQIGTNEILLD